MPQAEKTNHGNDQSLTHSVPGESAVTHSSFSTSSASGISGKMDARVNRKGFIEAQGVVEELLPSASFKIILENGYEIRGYLSGRMRMNRIKLLPGDRVKVELSPYDLTKGRITYRN
ncbi:MAG: Translation initiation factor IF-1 [Parcubacteria group bacterium GW2011_GWA2_44_12]|nr:MAG: Translation initiation factor IF-1 [Parcubacteria group bacterium GW2011_GWA2_44_12]